LSGAVEVRFLVNAEGFVRDVRILESNPPDIFDDSVLKVLPTWRFKPGKFRGKAVDTLVVTTIEFKLEG
jgi:protein TonB